MHTSKEEIPNDGSILELLKGIHGCSVQQIYSGTLLLHLQLKVKYRKQNDKARKTTTTNLLFLLILHNFVLID